MRARRLDRRGFTLIEVMVALGVMTIGSMAIMTLLGHILRANSHARQLNTAMSISVEWVERLKQDAHSWTQAAVVVGTPNVTTVLQNTLYLRNITTPPSLDFIPIPATAVTSSVAFDYQGNDLVIPLVGNAAIFYCTAYRANWVYFGSLMRVDVRVFWPRAGTGANMATEWPSCTGAQNRLEPGGALVNRYHVLQVPVVIGVTPVVR